MERLSLRLGQSRRWYARGQPEVLASYNVRGNDGVKIDASMDVAELGQTESGTPVYVSKPAYEADGIIARIKPIPFPY